MSQHGSVSAWQAPLQQALKSWQHTPLQQTPLQHWAPAVHSAGGTRQHASLRQSWKSQQSQVSVQEPPVRWQQVGADPGLAAWHVEVASQKVGSSWQHRLLFGSQKTSRPRQAPGWQVPPTHASPAAQQLPAQQTCPAPQPVPSGAAG
jgi:hypothetical protein